MKEKARRMADEITQVPLTFNVNKGTQQLKGRNERENLRRAIMTITVYISKRDSRRTSKNLLILVLRTLTLAARFAMTLLRLFPSSSSSRNLRIRYSSSARIRR